MWVAARGQPWEVFSIRNLANHEWFKRHSNTLLYACEKCLVTCSIDAQLWSYRLVQTASLLLTAGTSLSSFCMTTALLQWFLWLPLCLKETKDGKDVLLTCKGFDYRMLQVNAGLLQLKRPHLLALTTACMQTTHLHANNQSRSTLLQVLGSTPYYTSFMSILMAKRTQMATCFFVLTISGQFHWSFHRLQEWHSGWIIVHFCWKNSARKCLCCLRESTVGLWNWVAVHWNPRVSIDQVHTSLTTTETFLSTFSGNEMCHWVRTKEKEKIFTVSENWVTSARHTTSITVSTQFK